MKHLFIIAAIAGILNSIITFTKGNSNAGIGWLVVAAFLLLLALDEIKAQKTDEIN